MTELKAFVDMVWAFYWLCFTVWFLWFHMPAHRALQRRVRKLEGTDGSAAE
jgi:hypothetical protein